MAIHCRAGALLISFIGIFWPDVSLALLPEESRNKGYQVIEFNSGVTLKHGESVPTFGLDYEYIPEGLGERFGFGLSLDEEFEHHRSHTFLGPMFIWFPGYHIKTLVSWGIAFFDGAEDSLFRLGVGYDHRLGDWIINPAVYRDWVQNHGDWVPTVGIGKKF